MGLDKFGQHIIGKLIITKYVHMHDGIEYLIGENPFHGKKEREK